MSGRHPEEKVAYPVVNQRWRDMTFLHWRYPPAEVAAKLPDGLEPDVYDGSAWVGLTPFTVMASRPAIVPTLFGSTFPETNLRTYVVGPDGRDGIWFLALDVGSLATAAVARAAYWVPYHWASMQVERATVIRYRSHRRIGSAAHDISIRPGEPIAGDDDLVTFVTGRWRAWTRIGGRLATVAVEHEPWPLQAAEVVELSESVTAAAGLPSPHGDPLLHFSPGVNASLGPPRLTRS